MVSRKAVLAVVGVVVLAGAAAGGYYLYALGSDFQPPELQSIDNEFGEATTETTDVRTQVVVFNPNEESIPGAAQLRYAVYLNDVKMADQSTSVGLQPGNNTVDVRTKLDNEKIPEWWVTHVNNGEETTLSLRPSVSLPAAPVGADLPAQNSTIRTDLLGALGNDEPRTVAVSNRTILEIGSQQAEWGEADMETTPILVSTELTNRHDEPVRLDGTQYRIEMNGVVVGEGRTDDSFSVAPGESTTYTVRPAIDTPKMQDWWVEHIRNNETTTLRVEVFGLVEDDGELVRVPLTVYEQHAKVGTDILGDGGTTVETLPTEGDGIAYEQPTVAASDSRWGEVSDAETEIVSNVTFDNPNDGELGAVVDLNVGQTTVINGVEAASGQSTLDGLEPGNNTLTLRSGLDHDTVPRWWARHLNGGEQSTIVTETGGSADVGITSLDFETDDRRRTLETNALASFNSTEDQPVEQEGRTVLVVKSTSATWGEATPQEAPIDTRVTIENRQSQPVTIRNITYTVTLNDVALADNRTVDESYTIAPVSTETITPTLVLDNQKTEEWWPTHVRNDERSTLSVQVFVTVESPFGSKRVALDSVSGDSTIETSIFEE